ncbi:hypothetical protein [Desulfosarcina sp.]|uniref:hypothetical protein n=1 Tax=Desulfosarcina sp. TaxID=2027861 RepID=UPI0035623802
MNVSHVKRKSSALLLRSCLIVLLAGHSASVYSYQVWTRADFFNPSWHNIENIFNDADTSSLIPYSATSDLVYSSSDLATGQLKVSAPTASGSGGAGWTDEILLTIPGLTATSTATIDIELTIEGIYTVIDYNNKERGYFSFNALSGLNTFPYPNVDQLAISATYSSDGTPGTYSTASPQQFSAFNGIGEWAALGPKTFLGQIEISGADPSLRLDFDLVQIVGPADFSNTASIRLDLPEGATFESASGVFLSEAAPVPISATLILFGTGIIGLAGIRKLPRVSGQQ